jgi:hypothetical protein
MTQRPAPLIVPGKRYHVRTDWASSSVLSLHYDADARTLDIEYPSGGVYRYFEVPAAAFRELFTAQSMGLVVNTRIKPHYRCEKL